MTNNDSKSILNIFTKRYFERAHFLNQLESSNHFF